ncbi:hypothetical protein BHE90_004084 [Fusarium euwallaceae]|uniref:P-type ATPase A domain-containing protein n=1 Tax=Fusarium euwallaceae TaxID=1147111 RepID=A0A430M073_9HYPO|nr:hypothetical protein BHE90_004084 [Fusarium euwallaceae]
MPVELVFDHLSSGEHGISDIEALAQRHIHGRNKGFAFLMIMVLISCVVRLWQEYQSGMVVFRLHSSNTNKFRMTVEGGGIDPGDVVILMPGAVVPADCLIPESSFVRISQSTRTDASEPVLKVKGSDDLKK